MAKMKTATLVAKLRENPEAAREFLNGLSDVQLQKLFPDHLIQVKMIEVKNLQSGKMVWIKANTPWACRVDSETYWSS